MLKLNLQMFAEGDEPGNDSTLDNEPGLSPSEQFDQMYYGTDDDQQDDDADNDTVNNDSGDVAGGDTDPADGDDDQQNQQNQQSQQQPWKNQQNADFAAQRRRQEEAQRIAQAEQRARDAVYAEQFKDKINPYTGQPIRTEADYKAYQQAYNAELLQNSGIQQSQFDQMVNADPRIQQAQKIIEQQEQMTRQNQQMQEARKLDEAVERIRKFDKSVKTQQDVIDNPHFQEIAQMYSRGYDLADAYYLANRTELEQQRQAATKQQFINQAAGKKHLKTTGQNGAGNEVHVPAETLAIYREMMPNATDDEIRAHYARLNKK